MAGKRFFNHRQKVTLFLAAQGKCLSCNEPLNPGWHADHRQPWSRGGKTEVQNGQALCAVCNLKKSDDEITETSETK